MAETEERREEEALAPTPPASPRSRRLDAWPRQARVVFVVLLVFGAFAIGTRFGGG